MANEEHLAALKKGVRHWNWEATYRKFNADLSRSDLRSIYLKRAELSGADLSQADLREATLEEADLAGAVLDKADLERAVLHGTSFSQASLRDCNLSFTDSGRAIFTNANLQGAKLNRALWDQADFSGANLNKADVRTLKHEEHEDARTKFRRTDLSGVKGLTQEQLDVMIGDSGTIIPASLDRPASWKEIDLSGNAETTPIENEPASDPAPMEETAQKTATAKSKPSTSRAQSSQKPKRIRKQSSLLRFTPPTEFTTKKQRSGLKHSTKRPEARRASATPMDRNACASTKKAILKQAQTLSVLLAQYEAEENSNRVRAAAQMLITCNALIECLQEREDEFLPTLMEDYIEVLAIGFQEEIFAFESNDRASVERLIKRARQHYACYPELAEIGDPGNTNLISDGFPYSVATLSAELDGIIYSADSQGFFSDQTRDLIEAEKAAVVHREIDAEKSKLARLSAIAGEMWREMEPQRARVAEVGLKAKGGIDKTTAWLKTFEKVEKIWEAVKPFIGRGDMGG